MSSSIFLSYPRPFKKRQEEFIERIIHYFEERELQPRTLGVTDYDMDAPLTAIRRLMLESNSKDIWYDWMMQYYTSTVIAFHRVKEANKNSIFNLKRPLAMNQILFDVLHSESKNIHSEYMTKCYFFELSVICSNIPILSIKSFSTGESVSSSRFLYLSYSA